MKKILFATDFSINAERAFEYALNLSRNHGAKITMLHIYDIPTSWNHPFTEDPLEMEKQEIRETERKLAALVEKHTGSDEILSFEYLVLGNKSIVKGILEGIIKSDAGILVVGNKGASNVKEIIVGSTTKALLDQSIVPVLAVPENIRQFQLKKILFASDYQKGDLRALNLTVQLFKPFKPEVHIVHVSPTDEIRNEEFLGYFKSQVHDLIKYPSIKFEILYSDHVAQSLTYFIEQNFIDLMVMLEKDRQGLWDQLFHRDLLKKMESQSTIPILSYSEEYLQNVPPGEKNIL
jgi:nucleotide-binding universal stress UspA family protein